jgi:hypothetical protein
MGAALDRSERLNHGPIVHKSEKGEGSSPSPCVARLRRGADGQRAYDIKILKGAYRPIFL